MNKILGKHEKIIINSDILSLVLGELISSCEQGRPVNKRAITFLLNKSMETTKADPLADSDQHDPLLEMSEFIGKTDILPTKNQRLTTILLKCFGNELLGSSRRARRAEYKSEILYANKILSSKGFVDLDLLIPSDEAIDKEKRKRRLENRRKFPKRREV